MKQIQTEHYTFTEIGGVGEMNTRLFISRNTCLNIIMPARKTR